MINYALECFKIDLISPAVEKSSTNPEKNLLKKTGFGFGMFGQVRSHVYHCLDQHEHDQ